MNNFSELSLKLFQTSIQRLDDNKIKILIKQNKFLAGTVHIDEKVYRNVARSTKNIFNLFGGGLGLNGEILNIIIPFFDVKKIIIPYQDSILITTPGKWRKLGIVSPYCNQRVDKQIILSLRDINMDQAELHAEPIEANYNHQMDLFGVLNAG